MSLNRVDDRDPRGWRRAALRAAAIVAGLVVIVFAFLVYVLLASSDPVYWAGEVAEFERLDISNPPEKNQIVFAGGGTIRQWDNLEQALAPLPVIKRGFGGAHVAHVTAYAPRIIQPYDPIAVVISAGADDLADVGGKPPDQVEADMAELIALLRPADLRARDEPQVYILSITPSPMRSARWPAFAQANTQLKALAEANGGVHFVDTASLIATDDGQMDESLYRWDGLAFNEEGYAVVGRAIRQRLMNDLGDQLGSAPSPTIDPLDQAVPAP